MGTSKDYNSMEVSERLSFSIIYYILNEQTKIIKE